MAERLSSLRLLESYLEDLETLVEENRRIREIEADGEIDQFEMRKLLSKITDFLVRNDDG